MIEVIFKTAITFFAIYGIVQIFKDVLFFLSDSHRAYDNISVVVKVLNNEETLEATIRMILWKILKITHGSFMTDILIVDMGSTDSTAEIAKRLCNDYSFIHYTTNELYLKNKSEKNISRR